MVTGWLVNTNFYNKIIYLCSYVKARHWLSACLQLLHWCVTYSVITNQNVLKCTKCTYKM